MPWLIPSLYIISTVSLVVVAYLVTRRRPRAKLHRYFAFGCLASAFWLITLLVFYRLQDPSSLLLVGRFNCASVLFVSEFAYLFMRELAFRPVRRKGLLRIATLALSGITLLTPLVDRAEVVVDGQHVTQFGLLFPLYSLQIVGLLGSAIQTAFVAAETGDRRLRDKVSVIGLVIFISSAVGITTNLVLPYAFHIFAFQEIGALSILFFISATAYAITARHLFDVRIAIRRTVLATVLIALVEKAYAFLISLVARAIPGVQSSATLRLMISAVTLIFIAVSLFPLRRWLKRRLRPYLSDGASKKHMSNET